MNVRLREAAEADLETFYLHQADPTASAMAGFRPRTREAFLEHWRTKVLCNPVGLKRAVLVDEQLVGNVLSFDLEGLRLVGYWYGRPTWGKGVATEALRQFLRLERLRPLHAWVIPSNRASMRVLEKNGFVQGAQRVDSEGVLEVQFTLAGPAAPA